MNGPEITKFLEAIGRKPGATHGSWIHTTCPLAPWLHSGGTDSDPSFGVKIQPGDSRVHCFSCNFSGTAGDVVMELHRQKAGIDFSAAMGVVADAVEGAPIELTSGDYEGEVFSPPAPPHVYPEELLGAFEPAWAIEDFSAMNSCKALPRVHPYLEARRVLWNVVRSLDLRWDVYRYRIVFPVRDFEGQLRGLHGRHADGFPFAPDDIKAPYKMYPHEGQTNSEVWLGEHWLDPEQPVLIAESVFDLCRCLELYPNTITPLTASLSAAKIQRLAGVARVVTLFDADTAGSRARNRLRHGLPDTSIHDVLLANGTDAADHHAGELADYLAAHLDLEG